MVSSCSRLFPLKYFWQMNVYLLHIYLSLNFTDFYYMLSIPYPECLGPEVFGIWVPPPPHILEYLYVHNEISWEFIYVSYASYTHALKLLLYIFSAPILCDPSHELRCGIFPLCHLVSIKNIWILDFQIIDAQLVR